MAKRNQMDRRSRRRQLPQRGYTQLLQGNRLATARANNVDMHVKHCFEVCRAVKNKTAGEAVAYLNEVLRIDSDRADVRRKAAAVPFRLGSGNKRKRRSGPSMVGHRKGGIGPGRYPVKASRAIIKKGDIILHTEENMNGHVITLFDEDLNILNSDKTGLWLQNRFYQVN